MHPLPDYFSQRDTQYGSRSKPFLRVALHKGQSEDDTHAQVLVAEGIVKISPKDLDLSKPYEDNKKSFILDRRYTTTLFRPTTHPKVS